MHHWQDFVLAASILAFNIALLPSIFSKHKPALATCLITASSLAATVVCYLTLSLWYTAVMQGINLLLWMILAVQRLQQSPPKQRRTAKR